MANLVEAFSENVIAMATREGLFFQFCFQSVTHIGKVTKVQGKSFCSFRVTLQKLQGGGGGGGTTPVLIGLSEKQPQGIFTCIRLSNAK